VDFLDEITVTGLRAFGRHGVLEQEREHGQEFVVDVTMHVSTRRAAETDDVADTIHYGEVSERVSALISGEPVNLIETLAERIAADLLSDERVVLAVVTVHKPSAPISVPFADVSVTIRRDRS